MKFKDCEGFRIVACIQCTKCESEVTEIIVVDEYALCEPCSLELAGEARDVHGAAVRDNSFEELVSLGLAYEFGEVE